jgi:hypothetical protein
MQTSRVNTTARKRHRVDYKIGQKPKPLPWAALSLINVRKHSHRWDIITCSAPASFGKSNKNRRPALQFPCARAIFIPRLCEIENLLKVCVRGDERERERERNSASWNEANSGWSSLYISCESNLFCGVCVSKFAFRITFFPQRRWAGGIKRCCRYKHVPYKRKRRLGGSICM